MPKLPRLTAREIITAIEKVGFIRFAKVAAMPFTKMEQGEESLFLFTLQRSCIPNY